MEVLEAMEGRRSVRFFLNREVPRDVLEGVINCAIRAQSASNVQPWEFMVLRGAKLRELGSLLQGLYRDRPPSYGKTPSPEIPEVFRRRMEKQVESQKPLLEQLGLTRASMGERAMDFYGAPAAILLLMHKALDPSQMIGIGAAIQNLALAAHGLGLGTCTVSMILFYGKEIMQHLEIPKDYRLVTSIAVGYPETTHPFNGFVSAREPLSAVTRWVGFNE
jgi:nitroreductase